MKEIDSILFFLLLGLIEVLVTQKKNEKAKDGKEIVKNNNKLMVVLLIALITYHVIKKMHLDHDAAIIIEFILFLVSIIGNI